MKLLINGIDVMDRVSLRSCVTESHASGRSDGMVLRFNDPKGLWSKWAPEISTVAFENGTFRTGKMYVHALRPENGCYTMRAYSMPAGAKVRRSKSWEGVRFKQLINETAERCGLTPELHGVQDHLYKYMQQNNQTDLAYLSALCTLEGCGLLIYDGKLIVYDELAADRAETGETVTLGPDGVFTMEDRTVSEYSGATIYSGVYSGSFIFPKNTHDRILYPETPCECTSDAEAARYARGLLRAANKTLLSGTFRQELHTELVAGSVIRLFVKKADFDARVFLTCVRHDHTKNVSTITYRKTLEDY
ncbi:MAG: hypothetical protein IJL59_04205 [Clostridia bacterium]|nr:hypothetical protein [Clostridia bacterium]